MDTSHCSYVMAAAAGTHPCNPQEVTVTAAIQFRHVSPTTAIAWDNSSLTTVKRAAVVGSPGPEVSTNAMAMVLDHSSNPIFIVFA